MTPPTRTPANDDSDLRRLMGDAVSDIRPGGGVEQIRARAQRPAAGRWVPLVLAAAVATVVVIGGVGWLGQRQSQAPAQSPAAGPGTSESSMEQEEPPAAQATRTVEVPVYYVGDTAAGPRLFAETHLVDGVSGSDLDAAVQALASPPTDPDYSMWASAGGLAASASSDGNTITIDLSAEVPRPAGMDAETARVSLQSLVWTVGAAADSAAPVRFTVAGRPADRVLGVDTSAPLERAGAESVLAAVSVSSPTEGATVPSGFEVRGQAATFEATVVWELKQGDTVVDDGFATARECCRLAPYTFTVTASPGDYTLVVRDTDESDGEGIGTSEDTKQISVE